jgi:peptide/nickel transport system substrate-binding protein
MRRLIATLLLAAVAATPLAAAAQSVLRIGIQDDPDSFDPARGYSYVGRIVFTSLCNKLIDVAPDLSFVPQLALAWDTAPDGRSVTFQLRPGVHFSDGTALDAAAVAFNLERAMNLPTSRRKSEVAALNTVDVIDLLTVRLNLKAPFTPLLAQLSDRAGLVASPAALQNPAGFDAAPACSGPFRFVSRIAQDRVVLARDPGYWDAPRIHLDGVEFRVITDPTVRLANLKGGGLDFAERILASDVAALKSDRRFSVLVGPSLQYNGITFNMANGKGGAPDWQKSAPLRAALEAAIDRGAINQVVFDGNAVIGNQPVPPSSRFYAPDRKVREGADPALAKKLVAESGVANPKLTLMVTNSADAQQIGTMIQSMAQEAGIAVSLQATEFQTQLSRQAGGDFQASLIGWSGRVDPDGNTYTLLGCKSPTNDGRWCGAAEPDLLAGQSDPSGETRIADYHRALRTIVDEHPIIYLYHPPLIFGLSAKVKGYVFNTDGLIRLQDVSLSP